LDNILKAAQYFAVMAYEEERGIIFVTTFTDQFQRFPGVCVIEIAGRFIGKDKPGPIRQRARYGDTLLLAS